MIAKLTGILTDILPQFVILDVSGVGYQVFISENWKAAANKGKEYSVYVSTQVKDDAIELFGFPNLRDRELFQLLLSVSGVGPKTALSIVSYGVPEIERAVQAADVDFFSSIPRIGKKNAQKIIIELKNKLGGFTELDLLGETDGRRQELIGALTGMGFSRAEVAQVIKQYIKEDVTLEQSIRVALQHLGKK